MNRLFKTRSINMNKSELLFYEIMNYPIPKNWEYFSTEKKDNIERYNKNTFSWEQESFLLEEYRIHIKKHKKIFQSIPRVKTIYLCNSISFNKLSQWSDIDFFIVTKKWCLRRARFASALIFFVLWLKRSKKRIWKKYCLSFYITEDAQNLYTISLPNTDIYLAYRLAHLTPIYQEKTEDKTIYDYNPRLFSILPNLPKNQHNINIWLPIYKWNTKIKTKLEKYVWWLIWHIVEYMIKTIRVPILIYKTKNLKEIWKDIIFNDTMLKFYQDKRKKIALLYRTRNIR